MKGPSCIENPVQIFHALVPGTVIVDSDMRDIDTGVAFSFPEPFRLVERLEIGGGVGEVPEQLPEEGRARTEACLDAYSCGLGRSDAGSDRGLAISAGQRRQRHLGK